MRSKPCCNRLLCLHKCAWVRSLMNSTPLPIPLIARLSEAEQAAWLQALQAAMPELPVCWAVDVAWEVRSHIPVAIVANPDPAELALFPNLQWVQSLWAGVEGLVATPAKFAIVRMTDPQLARSMAEAVLAWTLYLHRDMPRYRAQQAMRVWRPHPLPAQRTVGILGLGHLGRAAAQSLVQQGFTVCGWSRSPTAIDRVDTWTGPTGLKAVLSRSQILVCLLPLTESTQGLLNTDTLAWLPAGAALINFARGPILITEALLPHLETGHLSHAVLDVFDSEPLPASSPLWLHPRVTVLPHIAAPTHKQTAAQIAAENIRQFLSAGTIPPSVDRRRSY